MKTNLLCVEGIFIVKCCVMSSWGIQIFRSKELWREKRVSRWRYERRENDEHTHTYKKREGMICQFVNELYILRSCTSKVQMLKIEIREWFKIWSNKAFQDFKDNQKCFYNIFFDLETTNTKNRTSKKWSEHSWSFEIEIKSSDFCRLTLTNTMVYWIE